MGELSFRFHQKNSSNKLFSKTFVSKNNEVIFMPGCSLSGYNEDIILNIYKYLKYHIPGIGISFSCCYKPSLMIKDKTLFDKNYNKLDETFIKSNIKEIITACPNCYKTIKENSKNVKVTFLLELIKEKGIDENLLNYYKDTKIKFAIHDSCAIRGNQAIYESCRYILDKLGIDYIEFDKNRQNSTCCGSIFVDDKKRLEQMKKRCKQTTSQYVISYCETCTKTMLQGGKNSIHILDLLFNKDMIDNKKFTQHTGSIIKSWENRY
ncbi:MAG: heterodisulfide reductase-related iron-sulfur binding cluster, partial [Romboutsia sp.]|uniref:heterodisulfide reductase-related iron-sulfur binding cluster n=1 Tax=Romboutsia sp. TaxID=1965302 RepID=UPI003F36A0AD